MRTRHAETTNYDPPILNSGGAISGPPSTDVDLSKYWVGKPKYWGQRVVKVINAWPFLNYWGARARDDPPSIRLCRLVFSNEKACPRMLCTHSRRLSSHSIPSHPRRTK